MFSINQFILCSALCVVAFAEHVESGQTTLKEKIRIHEVNMSATFDKILPSVRQYIVKNGFDPMDLPDVEIALSPLPALLNTKMHLHHGHLQQMSTIFRTGDIIVQWNGDRGSVDMSIGFETLDLSHQYILKYLLYTREGDCYGRFHDVHARMLMDVDFTTRKFSLRFFKLISFGDFKIKLEGHFTDKLWNFLINAMTKAFKSQILRIVESTAADQIQKQLDELNEASSTFQNKIKKILKGEEIPNFGYYDENRILYA